MSTPFVFGKIAGRFEFANRKNEIKKLEQNFGALTNTMLISPRRWGKSSLVARAAQLFQRKNKEFKFCFIDLYDIRSEESFYQVFAEEIFKATHSKWEERVRNAEKIFKQWIPKISFNPQVDSEFSLGLDWQEVKKRPEEILNLAEKIAKDKKIKIIICIDEFQNISSFENQLAIQKKLRANWQKHKHVSYVLYGSKRHMLMDVFTSASMPFYKFGDIIFLEKLDNNDWKKFIVKRFKDTGKKISSQDASFLASLVQNHPYYVQQLAQKCWYRSTPECNEEIILEAHESLMSQLGMLFQTITDGLKTTQVNFLKAVLKKETKFSSKKVISDYRLGTSANVKRIREALINKEIIESISGKIIFLDPVYQCWLTVFYLKLGKQNCLP